MSSATFSIHNILNKLEIWIEILIAIPLESRLTPEYKGMNKYATVCITLSDIVFIRPRPRPRKSS